MATIEKDIFGKDFGIGSYVYVRCVVTSITPTEGGAPAYGSSFDTIGLTVENINPSDMPGVTLSVSASQCRWTGDRNQG